VKPGLKRTIIKHRKKKTVDKKQWTKNSGQKTVDKKPVETSETSGNSAVSASCTWNGNNSILARVQQQRRNNAPGLKPLGDHTATTTRRSHRRQQLHV
jgi:hypothetical protein